MNRSSVLLGLAALLWLSAFAMFSPEAVAKGDPAKGKEIYLKACTACHTRDPSWGNAQAPALTGSSRELIEARVMRAEYPPGYTPKKPTKLMVPLPQYGVYIDDLYAFLNQ